LADRHPTCDPADRLEKAASSAWWEQIRGINRQRYPRSELVRQRHLRRGDADNGVRRAAYGKPAAEHAAVAAEARAPELVADDDDLCGGRAVLAAGEDAPDLRANPEHRKPIRRHPADAEAERIALARQDLRPGVC